MHSAALRRNITTTLRSLDSAEGQSLDRLVEVLYDELKAMARRQLAREVAGHTLQPTALVHEAYVKLAESPQLGGRQRSYFFAAAARAMRQVLVEHARRRNAAKRGRGAVPISLDSSGLHVDAFAVELLDLDRALEELAAIKPLCTRGRVPLLRRAEREPEVGSLFLFRSGARQVRTSAHITSGVSSHADHAVAGCCIRCQRLRK